MQTVPGTGFVQHVAIGRGGDGESVRYADALSGQLLQHLAQRGVLSADERHVVDAEVLKEADVPRCTHELSSRSVSSSGGPAGVIAPQRRIRRKCQPPTAGMQQDRAEGHSMGANGGQRDAQSEDLVLCCSAASDPGPEPAGRSAPGPAACPRGAINVVPTSTRFGVAPSNNEALPVTPRRPLTEVLSEAAASPRDVVPADRGLAALSPRPPRSA